MKAYGAWWCIPCDYQKELFGDKWELIKPFYIECYGEKELSQIQECTDAKIGAFPAWDFPGGREYGTLTFEDFENLSGCEY